MTFPHLDPRQKVKKVRTRTRKIIRRIVCQQPCARACVGAASDLRLTIELTLAWLRHAIAVALVCSLPTGGKKKDDDFVPYRNSVLTWLLKVRARGYPP